MTTLAQALTQATQTLHPSDTARLDAEILLTEILQTSRTYLIAHAERLLTDTETQRYQEYVARRQQGEPLAYILGHKEFWSLDLTITPAVLVPRPETELLVELILQLFPEPAPTRRVADLGTGSGAIALALASERPHWEIYATDQSAEALALATRNAERLGRQSVIFRQGKWCHALPPLLFDAIVSNPPYLTYEEWKKAPRELSFEPVAALVAEEEGLRDLHDLVSEAKSYLLSEGWLLLEHGAGQAAAVRQLLQNEDYVEVSSYCDLAGIERATIGQKR